jgi:hypothetical protein
MLTFECIFLVIKSKLLYSYVCMVLHNDMLHNRDLSHGTLFNFQWNKLKFQWQCFIKTGLCKMGILVIVIVIISKSFQIITCHRSSSILESFLLIYFTPFQCSFSFIYLYLVVNFFNKPNFCSHFAYQIKNV